MLRAASADLALFIGGLVFPSSLRLLLSSFTSSFTFRKRADTGTSYLTKETEESTGRGSGEFFCSTLIILERSWAGGYFGLGSSTLLLWTFDYRTPALLVLTRLCTTGLFAVILCGLVLSSACWSGRPKRSPKSESFLNRLDEPSSCPDPSTRSRTATLLSSCVFSGSLLFFLLSF